MQQLDSGCTFSLYIRAFHATLRLCRSAVFKGRHCWQHAICGGPRTAQENAAGQHHLQHPIKATPGLVGSTLRTDASRGPPPPLPPSIAGAAAILTAPDACHSTAALPMLLQKSKHALLPAVLTLGPWWHRCQYSSWPADSLLLTPPPHSIHQFTNQNQGT